MLRLIGTFALVVLVGVFGILAYSYAEERDKQSESHNYLYVSDGGAEPSDFLEKEVVKETRKEYTLDTAFCIKKLKELEGYKSKPYKDINGVYTFGYGTTRALYKDLVKAKYIEKKDPEKMVLADHEKILAASVKFVYSQCLKKVPALKYMSGKAQAAFVSWTYQCGLKGITKNFPIVKSESFIEEELLKCLTGRAMDNSPFKRRRMIEAAMVVGVDIK